MPKSSSRAVASPRLLPTEQRPGRRADPRAPGPDATKHPSLAHQAGRAPAKLDERIRAVALQRSVPIVAGKSKRQRVRNITATAVVRLGIDIPNLARALMVIANQKRIDREGHA